MLHLDVPCFLRKKNSMSNLNGHVWLREITEWEFNFLTGCYPHVRLFTRINCIFSHPFHFTACSPLITRDNVLFCSSSIRDIREVLQLICNLLVVLVWLWYTFKLIQLVECWLWNEKFCANVRQFICVKIDRSFGWTGWMTILFPIWSQIITLKFFFHLIR